MKILAVSDEVEERLHSARVKENIPHVDLILGCGDLPYGYLEFLVSIYNVPLFYVPGNHDPAYNRRVDAAHADGCDNIDRRVVSVKGLTIAGLGGCILYKPSAVNQYTQSQMWQRFFSLSPALLWSQARSGGRLDLMIAHSPPRGINDDEEDPAHTGFNAFTRMIKIFRPHYFLHGHVPNYKSNLVAPHVSPEGTQVINISPFRLLEVETRVR